MDQPRAPRLVHQHTVGLAEPPRSTVLRAKMASLIEHLAQHALPPSAEVLQRWWTSVDQYLRVMMS